MRTLETLTDVLAQLDTLPGLQGEAKDEVMALVRQYITNEHLHINELHGQLLAGEHAVYHMVDQATKKPVDYRIKYTPIMTSNQIRRYQALKQSFLYGVRVLGITALMGPVEVQGPHSLWRVLTTFRTHDIVSQTLLLEFDHSVRFDNNKHAAPVYEIERLLSVMEQLLDDFSVVPMHSYLTFNELDMMVRGQLFRQNRSYKPDDTVSIWYSELVATRTPYRYTVTVHLNPATAKYDSNSEITYELHGIDERFIDYVVSLHKDDIVRGLAHQLAV